MIRLKKDEAIKSIQHRRAQMKAILKQNIPARDLGRKFRLELDQVMICCLLSDIELGMLSVEHLNDIIENGWWSDVGRLHLLKWMERQGRPASD